MSAELWPSIPAVLRVMTGWGLVGVSLLDLAVEVDGGLTRTYLLFHLIVGVGGVLLLARRPSPSRAGGLVAAGLAVAALALTALPGSAGCCPAGHPGRHGFPFPFLGNGDGDGLHVESFYLAADLIFWACAGLLLATVVAVAERFLPERRTPVDLSRYAGHAEPRTMAAVPDHADENVGGLT